MQRLSRNVPPRIYLAMAAAEQDEKYQRRPLMEKLKCSELEVVEHTAEEMMSQRVEKNDND